jgi:hypothetical protein
MFMRQQQRETRYRLAWATEEETQRVDKQDKNMGLHLAFFRSLGQVEVLLKFIHA